MGEGDFGGRKGRNNFYDGSRSKEMKIVVADSTAGRIIGKKGDTVKRIQTVSGDVHQYSCPISC